MVGVALRLPVECAFLVLQFSLSLNYFLVRWSGSVHETASDVPYSAWDIFEGDKFCRKQAKASRILNIKILNYVNRASVDFLTVLLHSLVDSHSK